MIALRSLFLALPLAASLAVTAWAAEGFVDGFDELPLMSGLTSVKEESLIFDKPGGRIVQAAARGAVSIEAVRRFYRDTVPQLGWRPTSSPGRFARDGEVLRVEALPAVEGARGLVTVRFSLSPE